MGKFQNKLLSVKSMIQNSIHVLTQFSLQTTHLEKKPERIFSMMLTAVISSSWDRGT